MTTVQVAAIVLAGEDKKSGPIGLAVILALCVICYFLFKSMSRHLRKVREEFPNGDAAETPEAVETPARPVPPPDAATGTGPAPTSEPDP